MATTTGLLQPLQFQHRFPVVARAVPVRPQIPSVLACLHQTLPLLSLASATNVETSSPVPSFSTLTSQLPKRLRSLTGRALTLESEHNSLTSSTIPTSINPMLIWHHQPSAKSSTPW